MIRLRTHTRYAWFPFYTGAVCGLLLGVGAALGNDIRVTNLIWLATGVTGQSEVKFDLSWENSWRGKWTEPTNNTVTGNAQDVENWDAAWVFVKFRKSGADGYSHATLSTNAADHTVPTGAGDVSMTNTVGLSNDGGKGLGVFIHRAAGGHGKNNIANVKLRWLQGADGVTNDMSDIRVHAVEMVYVPEGPFALGSALGAEGTESNCFYKANGTNQPYIVTNELAITVSSNAVEGNLWAAGAVEDSTIISNAFPKGYAAFYCMKYEISQGQYADFLNGLSIADATQHYPTGAYGVYRYTVLNNAGVYSAARPDRVCNFIAWSNGAAYAAWTGLRPMSELEYGKACRGPIKPVTGEYAWGTATIIPEGDLVLSGAEENGAETVTNDVSLGAAVYRLQDNNHIMGGDGGQGPLRVGIFATNNSVRVSSGATYWGIMEVSGSVWERPVTIGNSTGRRFEGKHGSGTLTLPGDWPQDDAQGAGVCGSSWPDKTSFARTADRTGVATAIPYLHYMQGFRCVRTMPLSAGVAITTTNNHGEARFSGGANDGYAGALLAPPSIRNQPVSNVTTNQATFNGYLVIAGSPDTVVFVLWGETNGGTNLATSSWAHTNWCAAGSWTDNTYPSTNITGLTGGKTYYYTFGATNVMAGVVAGSPVSFVVLEETNETMLTVTASAGGTVTPSGAIIVTQNISRAISAIANPCYSFTNWTVTSGTAMIGDSNAAGTMVTITAPAIIRANFIIISPDADTDGDGMTDGEEDLAGTNPNDSGSTLRIMALTAVPATSNQFVVTWQSAAGRKYAVQATTNLVDGFNLNLLTNISATPPENVHTDHVDSVRRKFYRIRLE